MDGSLVFGNGHLTWEWEHGVRTYLHPALFAILFKILKFVNLDTPFLVTIGMYYVHYGLSIKVQERTLEKDPVSTKKIE